MTAEKPRGRVLRGGSGEPSAHDPKTTPVRNRRSGPREKLGNSGDHYFKESKSSFPFLFLPPAPPSIQCSRFYGIQSDVPLSLLHRISTPRTVCKYKPILLAPPTSSRQKIRRSPYKKFFPSPLNQKVLYHLVKPLGAIAELF